MYVLYIHIGCFCCHITNDPSFQPETPQLHNCPQFVDAVHDNWDVHFAITGHKSASHIISWLYAAFSSSFPLPFTQSHAKWLLMHLPFWLLSFTPCGPDPCPGSLGKVQRPRSAKQDSCALRVQICGCWLNSTYTLCEPQRSYSAYSLTGAWCYWSTLLLSVYSSPCSLPPFLSSHALVDMHSEAACILNVCPT